MATTEYFETTVYWEKVEQPIYCVSQLTAPSLLG
jgi:hypothetical protein